MGALARSELLFKPLEDEEIEGFRVRFAGSQAERADAAASAAAAAAAAAVQAAPAAPAPRAPEAPAPAPSPEELAARFETRVRLKVGRITAVERHPKADKLYIEKVDLGDEQRQIVSGLVPHYREDELLGRHILLVANLKPARLRGVESQGMLLAAGDGQTVEVLFADQAAPGSAAALEGSNPAAAAPAEPIDIDEFLSIPIRVTGHQVRVGSRVLAAGGAPVRTLKVAEGEVR